ncbi:MAG TPA: branched-chain amino acid ABC transporter permease [Jatrophihabitans sp.]|nr:branched-chain amino acid ABC transporter permease [Jatrophihabitans sp.]
MTGSKHADLAKPAIADPAAVASGRRARALAPWLTPVVLVAIMLLVPYVVGDNTVHTLQEVLALAVFAAATNLLLGQAGLVSFGQAVFFGLGAYSVALGWLHWDFPFWATFVASPFVGAIVAVPVGLIALRARRWYFALSTLAFSQLAYQLAESRYSFTKGANGVFGPYIPNQLATNTRIGYFFLLGVGVASLLLLWKVNHSSFGLVLRATRENRDRMQALGVNVYRHQLVAFVISGGFCSLAGAMFLVFSQSAYPELLDWTQSGTPVFMAVIGGMGTFLGPVVGAFIYQFGHDRLVLYTSHWQLVFGAVLALIIMFWPEGLLGGLGRAVAALRRRLGERHR